MKKYLIILACLLLCIPEMHGQGTKLGEKFLKGLSYKKHVPISTKPGKPFTIQHQVKLIDSEWIKIVKKDHHLSSEIDINRKIKDGTKLFLKLKPTNGASLYLDNPIQSIVWRGHETELFTGCRLLKSLPSGMTGFQIEEELWAEGDSVPFAKDYIDIEVKTTNEEIYKPENSALTQVENANVGTMKRGPGRSQEFMFKDSTHYFNSQKDFWDFLEKHEKKSNTNIEYVINSSFDNFVNQAFVSFLNRWIQNGTVKFFSAPACARFLYEYDLKKDSEINTYINWFRNAYYEQEKFYKGNNTYDEVEKWFSD